MVGSSSSRSRHATISILETFKRQIVKPDRKISRSSVEARLAGEAAENHWSACLESRDRPRKPVHTSASFFQNDQ